MSEEQWKVLVESFEKVSAELAKLGATDGGGDVDAKE